MRGSEKKYNYTYKITLEGSEKYYVGRHSTDVLDDGYMGSGNWVKSIKDKSRLRKEILTMCEDFETVKMEEQMLLDMFFGTPNCMNESDRNTGFATGINNIAHDPKEKERRSRENWMKTEAGRAWGRMNTRFKDPEVRELIRLSAIKQWQDPEYRENHSGDNHFTRNNPEWSEFMSNNNPMYREDVRDKISEHMKELARQGKHPSQSDAARKRSSILSRERLLKDNPMKRPEVVEKMRGPKPRGVCPACSREMSIQGLKGPHHIKRCSVENDIDPVLLRESIVNIYPNKEGK